MLIVDVNGEGFSRDSSASFCLKFYFTSHLQFPLSPLLPAPLSVVYRLDPYLEGFEELTVETRAQKAPVLDLQRMGLSLLESAEPRV